MESKENLLWELEKINSAMLHAEEQQRPVIEQVAVHNRNSAINLINYLSLRSVNIEALQLQLHDFGLSSLASSESHIKSQVQQVIQWLNGQPAEACEVDARSGLKQLEQNIVALLGVTNTCQTVPIMVTFDTSFADNPQRVIDLLENGMRIARINCAHDDMDTWARMIASLEEAKEKASLPCRIYMDLAGPKIRTQIMTRKHHHGKLKVAEGDQVILTDSRTKIRKTKKFIQCSLPGIIENLKPDQRVLFDDGLFEAIVQSVQGNIAILMIVRIASKKPAIKSDKGINFPDTRFRVDPITTFDRKCLPFIVKYADMVGFSFVNNASDMQELQKELGLLNRKDFPIVAKIETSQSVEHLPEIILQGMQQRLTGVMVARGDLAIEIGFERMSEIQDEILWICEAAHTPVIWATQVLENMHKKGIPTRGEVTDAAHAAEADCVMINKGDYTLKVLKTLNDILLRSRKNNFKNRRLFRKLSIASNFIGKQKGSSQ